MYTTVGRLSTYLQQGLQQGVYIVSGVSGPFHPFGGAVDIIVVEQQDGSFKCTPWYVKFGKFQGVLKRREKTVTVAVNDEDASFHMYLDHRGEAYFLEEEKNPYEGQQEIPTESDKADQDISPDEGIKTESTSEEDDENEQLRPLVANSTLMSIQRVAESEESSILEVYEKTEALEETTANNIPNDSAPASPGTEVIEDRYLLKAEKSHDNIESDIKDEMEEQVHEIEEQVRDCENEIHEVTLVASSSESSTNRAVVSSSEDRVVVSSSEDRVAVSSSDSVVVSSSDSSTEQEVIVVEGSATFFKETTTKSQNPGGKHDGTEKKTWGWWGWRGTGSGLSKQGSGLSKQDLQTKQGSADNKALQEQGKPGEGRSILGMVFGASGKERQRAQGQAADSGVVKLLEDKWTIGNGAQNLDTREFSDAEVILISGDGHIVVAKQDDSSPRVNMDDDHVSVFLEVRDDDDVVCRMQTQQRNDSTNDDLQDQSSEATIMEQSAIFSNDLPQADGVFKLVHTNGYYSRSWKVRTLIPTSAQLASLNLKKGRNKITFTYSTSVLGNQKVDARIYLWKWDAKVVLSDVDGTITKSDVLGQVMPLVGRDWTQTGVARLFSAIKDNGYELMFLSARAISQAYLTRQFLVNLKQDGEALPDGPVVISPDGLFPSLYREVIRRAPHEFKIACLEDIKALFPSETQPFYAGFGNRETDEISYLKVGIPKGKIFIINPKGEVIVNNFLDLKSYTSLHKLVNDMFPPVHMTEREDFNSWNFWRVPLPQIEDL